MSESLTKSKVKFEIATNFDPKLIHEIAKYSDTITWVYGKMNHDIIGGGRSTHVIPKLSWKELKDYIDLCHENNIKFNYLLNSVCMGNQEFEKKHHRKILKLLDKIVKVGTDSITVSSPYLCGLIKSHYPEMKITVSVHCRIRTLQQIEYWVQMGAEELTLFHTVNRDFDMLKKMLQYTKNTGIILRVIGNNACMHECPMQVNHAVGQAHASRKRKITNSLNIDYHMLVCNNTKVKDPAKLLGSEWIRPEDVKHYENICEETGNFNLSIKITDRTRTTEFLVRAAKAYMERNYDGNLLDIINYVGNRDFKKIRKLPTIMTGIFGLYNLKELSKLNDVGFAPMLYIDNKKLDGFIDGFVKKYPCGSMVCDESGWKKENKNNKQNADQVCKYCRAWSEKAITCDEKEREEWVEKSDDFISGLRKSRLFFMTKKKKTTKV